MKLRSSKTKLFYETSFKTEASKLKNLASKPLNEAFLRDFLQKWSFEALKRSFSARLPPKMKLRSSKRSFSARLPSKMKLRRSKTTLFCETSFKNDASKLYNEAFLRDFLQKWSCETQKRSFSARLPSKMKLRNSKTKLFCETSSKNHASGTNRVTGDHKGAAPFSCGRCGTSSTPGHLWPYLFYFKT